MIGKIILWLIVALGVVFFIMIFSGNETGINGGLWLTYITMLAAAGLAIVFGIVQMISAGKASIPSLIGIGAFAVLVAITYAMADDSVKSGWGITPGASQWIGAGITMTLLAAGVAVAAIIFGEVSRIFK